MAKFHEPLLGNVSLAIVTPIEKLKKYIRQTGFEIQSIQKESMRKAPAFVYPTIRGIAIKPGFSLL